MSAANYVSIQAFKSMVRVVFGLAMYTIALLIYFSISPHITGKRIDGDAVGFGLLGMLIATPVAAIPVGLYSFIANIREVKKDPQVAVLPHPILYKRFVVVIFGAIAGLMLILLCSDIFGF